MTRADIKAELRRSACEDERPRSMELGPPLYALYAHRCLRRREYFGLVSDTRYRIFMLIVAEALND